MKALLREFAPTVIFAVIVISLLTTTLSRLNTHISNSGIENEHVIGRLNMVDYRLDKLEKALCPPLVTSTPEGDCDGS